MKIDIKKILSEQLGIEPSDIDSADSLENDLHMGAVELTDMFEVLENAGVNTSEMKIAELKTVADLEEAVEQ